MSYKQIELLNSYELLIGKNPDKLCNQISFAKYCYDWCQKNINNITSHQSFTQKQLQCLKHSIIQYKKGFISGTYNKGGALHDLTEFLLGYRQDPITIDSIIIYIQLYNLYTINNK